MPEHPFELVDGKVRPNPVGYRQWHAFLAGMGSALSIAPPAPPKLPDDATALANDWKAVGDDLRAAMGQLPS